MGSERVAPLAACLCGAHDFTAFANAAARPARLDPICTLDEATPRAGGRSRQARGGGAATMARRTTCTPPASATRELTVRGDRFLYKMVRTSLALICGCGEPSTDEVRARRRGAFAARPASMPLTAPAHGLVLRSVDYAPADDPFLVVA